MSSKCDGHASKLESDEKSSVGPRRRPFDRLVQADPRRTSSRHVCLSGLLHALPTQCGHRTVGTAWPSLRYVIALAQELPTTVVSKLFPIRAHENVSSLLCGCTADHADVESSHSTISCVRPRTCDWFRLAAFSCVLCNDGHDGHGVQGIPHTRRGNGPRQRAHETAWVHHRPTDGACWTVCGVSRGRRVSPSSSHSPRCRRAGKQRR
jgi:hypothetical protein